MVLISSWAFLNDPNDLDSQKKELKDNIEKHQQNKIFNIEILVVVLSLSLFVNLLSNALYDYVKGTVTPGTDSTIIITLFVGYFLFRYFREILNDYKPEKPSFYCNYDLNLLIRDEHDEDSQSIKRFKEMRVDRETFEPLVKDIFTEFVNHDVKLFSRFLLKQLKLIDSEIHDFGFVCDFIGNISGIQFSFEIHMIGKFRSYSRFRKLENIEFGLRADIDTPDLPNADEIIENLDDWFRFFYHSTGYSAYKILGKFVHDEETNVMEKE